MAITLVGTPVSGVANNGGLVTLTFSTAPQEGDVTVAIVGTVSATSNPVGMSTSGYSLAGQVIGSGNGQVSVSIYYKVQGATPDTTAVCAGANGSTTDSTAIGYVLRGVDTISPLDQTTAVTGQIASTNPNPPSIVTQTDGAWVIVTACSRQTIDTSVGTITNYTNHIQVNGDDSYDHVLASATREITTAGTEDPGAWSAWNTGTWAAITSAFKPLILSDITVALNTPTDTDTVTTLTPTLTFTGTDTGSHDIRYHLNLSRLALFTPTNYYQFEENTGTTTADSNGGLNISLSSASIWSTGGKLGTYCVNPAALYYGTFGTSSSFQYLHNGLSNWTINVWYYKSVGQASGRIFSNTVGGDRNGMEMWYGDTTVGFYIGTTASPYVAPIYNNDKTDVPSGEGWNMYTVTCDISANPRYNVYLNGSNIASGNLNSGAAYQNAASYGVMNLGRYVSGGNPGRNKLDELTFLSGTALTSSQISALYNGGDGMSLAEVLLLDKVSGTDAGFARSGDSDPFTSGEPVTYTIQSGEELTHGATYSWRVRGIDPNGLNVYGPWTTPFTFNVNTSEVIIYNRVLSIITS